MGNNKDAHLQTTILSGKKLAIHVMIEVYV